MKGELSPLHCQSDRSRHYALWRVGTIFPILYCRRSFL